jgi:hypothetical protein
MKISLFLTALLCILLIVTACPWSSGFSGVRWPNAIADGAGGAVVVYQVNEDDTRAVYVQKLEAGGETLWSGKGVPLYSEPGPSEGGGLTASIINSDDGRTFIVWIDKNGTHAQKVDVSGSFLWNENTPASSGTYSTNVVGDTSGGMIVSSSGGNLNFQHLDSNGNILWETTSHIGIAQFFNFTVDALGNTFIVWEDKDFNIFTQKLDPAGNISWTPSGVLLSRNVTGGGMQSIISDGASGAIITWTYSKYIYAQRLNSEGETLWGIGGISLNTPVQMPLISMPIEPQLVSDGAGGAYITWRDGMSIFGQRINASGEAVWQEDNMQIWYGEDSPSSPLFNSITDSSGGLFVVWNYIEAGKMVGDAHDIRAQHFDASGNKFWGENGILVIKESPGYITPMHITPDGNGGAFVSWAAGANIHNASLSYIQRVSADGTLLWGENGIILK